MPVAFLLVQVYCQFELLCPCCGPVSGKEIGEVLLAEFILRHSAEDVLQPEPLINSVGFAGGEEGVYYGRPLRGIIVTAEQVVLAALCWQCNYVGIVAYRIVL